MCSARATLSAVAGCAADTAATTDVRVHVAASPSSKRSTPRISASIFSLRKFGACSGHCTLQRIPADQDCVRERDTKRLFQPQRAAANRGPQPRRTPETVVAAVPTAILHATRVPLQPDSAGDTPAATVRCLRPSKYARPMVPTKTSAMIV